MPPVTVVFVTDLEKSDSSGPYLYRILWCYRRESVVRCSISICCRITAVGKQAVQNQCSIVHSTLLLGPSVLWTSGRVLIVNVPYKIDYKMLYTNICLSISARDFFDIVHFDNIAVIIETFNIFPSLLGKITTSWSSKNLPGPSRKHEFLK